MAENKTHPTTVTPEAFLATVTNQRRRAEGERVLAIMREVTGEQGTMWGPSMVGFGLRHYTSAAGREGDWFKVGFSPRSAQFTFYGLKDLPAQNAMLAKLGPHTTGVGCIYAKSVDQLDERVLRDLIAVGFAHGDFIA
jgi:hypothetical protein